MVRISSGIETDATKVSTTPHVCILLVSGWSEHKLDLVKYTNICDLQCHIVEDIREPIIQRPDWCMIHQEYM